MTGRQMTPTEWFDQFIPYLGGIAGSEQWCARHWAPCPLMGANGLMASLELTMTILDEYPPADDQALDGPGDRPSCCALGDGRMYEIWGHCPPVPRPKEVPGDQPTP